MTDVGFEGDPFTWTNNHCPLMFYARQSVRELDSRPDRNIHLFAIFSPTMEGQEIRQEIPPKKNIFAILRTSVEQERGCGIVGYSQT